MATKKKAAKSKAKAKPKTKPTAKPKAKPKKRKMLSIKTRRGAGPPNPPLDDGL